MKKKKKHIEIDEVSDVKLKPIFGLHPGLYLTVLYALILLLILFSIFVLPGLRKYGSHICFTSEPAGAAVFVDGVYLDSTPFTRFVPAGKHTVRYDKPYFEGAVEELKVPGKIFGTLLFQRAESHAVQMDITRPEQYLHWKFGQVSNWALVGSFYDRYRYPFRGVQAVSEYLAGAQGHQEKTKDEESAEDVPEDLYDFTYMLLNNIASFEQLLDVSVAIQSLKTPEYRFMSKKEYTSGDVSSRLFQSAKETLVGRGAPPVLTGLYVETALRQNTGLAEELLPEYRMDRDVVEEHINELPFSEMYAQSNIESDPLQVQDHTFIEVTPPAHVAVGNSEFTVSSDEYDFFQLSEFPHLEELKPYYISTSEVTREQFDRFMQEEPRWSIENVDELIRQGKADEQYLAYAKGAAGSFTDTASEPATLPVTNVSWYAAKAYSQWVEAELPPELKERFRVRLPTETEWEFAARKNSGARAVDRERGFDGPQPADYNREGRLGLVDMRGNVWEWNENWYFPSDVLDGVYGAALPNFDGSEKALRGGSWANRAAEVPVWRRASHPPQWSSPFVGFRIVLEPRKDK